VINLIYNLTTDALEKKAKKYSKSYSFRNSYTGSPKYFPAIKIEQFYQKKNVDSIRRSLEITLLPAISENKKSFYYYIDKVNVSKSGVKYNPKFFNNLLIEVVVTFHDSAEVKTFTSKAIQYPFIRIPHENKIENQDFRTDNIPFGKHSILTEVSVNIVESNAKGVDMENISEMMKGSNESVKDVVNVIFGNLYQESVED
jgi:hypothetical protein